MTKKVPAAAEVEAGTVREEPGGRFLAKRMLIVRLERHSILSNNRAFHPGISGYSGVLRPHHSYPFVTGLPHLPNYWKAMRYFFHIFDGPKVFPDEAGTKLSSPGLAILQARALVDELRKAGEFCRFNLVFVLDENGSNIFRCRVT